MESARNAKNIIQIGYDISGKKVEDLEKRDFRTRKLIIKFGRNVKFSGFVKN